MTATEKIMKVECVEPFYYGKRLKAQIICYNVDGVKMYKVILYKHKMEVYKQKTFFDFRIKSDEYIKQNELYTKAYNYAMDYLNNICVY